MCIRDRVIKDVRSTLEIVRMAISAVARSSITTVKGAGLEIPFNIACHKKIEPAVTVIIKPASACRPSIITDAGFLCDIGKRAVAIIAVSYTHLTLPTSDLV